MNNLFLNWGLIVSMICVISCSNNAKNIEIAKDTIELIDSMTAAKLIVEDDGDRFFDKIQALDVAIQLKNNDILLDKNYVNTYKNFLQTQTSNFSNVDKEYMNGVLKEVKQLLKSINPAFPLKFSVAKIKSGHYGNDVFYTRGNVIYLPENTFQQQNAKKLSSIMLHEIWHILSEQRPELKSAMYHLIGFEPHNLKLKFPHALKVNLLTNPDGGDYGFALKTKNGEWLLPLIRSNQNRFDKTNPVFFNYLQFDVFYIDANGEVKANNDLSSTVSVEDNAYFFEKIKDNTQYIIHPDEIIADNFMLSVMAHNNQDFKNFSKPGQILLKEVLEKIRGIQ